MKLIILIPIQKSRYSVMYNDFDSLISALDEMNVTWEKILVKKPRIEYDGDDIHVKIIEGRDLKRYIETNTHRETIFLTIDDYYIMKILFRLNTKDNLLIWAHYFLGHRFIFRRYNNIDRLFHVSFISRIFGTLSGMLPNSILRILFHKYVETLKHANVVSQSIWTDLLLERVYSIRTLGILLTPLNQGSLPINLQERAAKLLLFLGNYDETDLSSLYDAIEAVKGVTQIDGIDFFGTEKTGKLFESHFHIKVEYAGKLSREELSVCYRSHFLTICPIFNGNFEMVPVESLMSGTPVISFIQPFMEVTGQSEMVANILNLSEIKAKVLLWRKLDGEIRERERNRILDAMDSRKVADQLMIYVSDIIKKEAALSER